MVSLTNPITAQNIINRYADYVVATSNSGIVWGTNSVPFSDFSTSYFGGTTAGRSIGITGGDINNNVNKIDASEINDTLATETAAYSNIRKLRAILNYTGVGDGAGGVGNTGTWAGNPGVNFDQTQVAYLNNQYLQSMSGTTNLGAGDIIDDSVLEAKFGALSTVYTAARNNTQTIQIDVCHSSCHSSCHGSRGRR